MLGSLKLNQATLCYRGVVLNGYVAVDVARGVYNTGDGGVARGGHYLLQPVRVGVVMIVKIVHQLCLVVVALQGEQVAVGVVAELFIIRARRGQAALGKAGRLVVGRQAL